MRPSTESFNGDKKRCRSDVRPADPNECVRNYPRDIRMTSANQDN